MKPFKYTALIILLGVFGLNCTDSPELMVKNQLATTIVFEVYSGDSLDYNLGTVEGYDLKQEASKTGVASGDSVTVPISTSDKGVMIVVGDSSDVWQSNKRLGAITGAVTVVIGSGYTISEQ